MRMFSSIPLSKLLIVYSMGIVLLSCGAIFVIVIFWQLPRIEYEIQAGQIRLAEAVAAQFAGVVDRMDKVARCAATTFDRQGAGNSNRLRSPEPLSQCVRNDSSVYAVYLLDEQGIIVGAGVERVTVMESALVDQDLSAWSFLREGAREGDVHWESGFISPLDRNVREVMVFYQAPYKVVVEFKREEIGSLVRQFSHDELGVLILDGNGRVIIDGMNLFHGKETFAAEAGFFSDEKTEKAIRPVSIQLDQQSMIGVVFPIPRLGWQVVVLQPRPEIAMSGQALGLAMLFVLLIALLFAAAGSAVMAMGFRRQFQRLKSFAENVKQGDYNTLEWQGARVTEFNDLAQAFIEMGEDIQSREVAIAEGQTAYREILESTTELAVKVSNRGKIIYANAAFCKLVEVPLEALVNQPLTAFLRDGDERSWRVAVGLDPGAGSIAFESFIVAANKHVYRVAWTVHAGRGENARKAYAAIGRDISDQWHMTEALRRSEVRLRAMLDNATAVAIQWYDTQGRVIYWGPGAEKLYGYTASEAVGRSIGQLHFDESITPKFREICDRILREGGTYGPERVTIKHADGSMLDVLATVFAMPADGGESYFVCMDIDISEQVREAAARREAERWFASVFQSSPVAMAVWKQRELYDANAAWESLFEMSVKEGKLATCGGEGLGFWEDAGMREAFIQQLLTQGEEDVVSAWIIGRRGARRLCQISGRGVDFGGTPMWIVAYKDITARHEAGEKLRELNETLEQRVAERTQALYRANHELSAALDHLSTTQAELIRSEKMAALGSLVAGVAHELSTPLGNSLLAANTLRDCTRTLVQEMASGLRRSTLEHYLTEAQEGNEIIERNLSRAAELVASFKQVAVDQSSSQRRSFTLMEVVDEIMITLRPSLKRLPFEVSADIEEGLVLDSYPGPLGQVLTNLINNAIIHAFDGRDHGVVRVTGRADGDDYLCMEVCDDGAGIPKENLPRLFDPFFTTRFGQQGSGLGLPIVHSLVTNLLGGTVTVRSTVGEGTCVCFRIPNIAPATRSS